MLGDVQQAIAQQPTPFAKTVQQSNSAEFHFRQIAPWIQDDWKATSRLTFNIGLRYDFAMRPFETDNKMFWLDPNIPGGGVYTASKQIIQQGLGDDLYAYGGDRSPGSTQWLVFVEKRGDTFPVTWAADDRLYTSAGDPVWSDKNSGLDVECLDGPAPGFHISRSNRMEDYRGWGGAGPKPSGMISVRGMLYLAFQNATGRGDSIRDNADVVMKYGHGYDAHFVASADFGHSWRPALKEMERPMFPGRVFGAPAFVNFGKDNEGARDAYVYAISGEGWDNGIHCRLGRVPHDKILERDAWEWVSKIETHGPAWSREMQAAVPVLTHPGYLGMVDMVYLSGAKRYLLLAWRNKVKADPDSGSELMIYDSPEPWGPFTFVYHEDPWESVGLNPYNPRLPLKWFDHTRQEGWLLFSGSWRSGGKTSTYRAHVRPFRLRTA